MPPQADVAPETAKAQLKAMAAFRSGDDATLPELGHISQPTLIVSGDDDVMVPTPNSFLLSQRIPDAQLIVYPRSNHASLFEYPKTFSRDVLNFIGAREGAGLD